jgi:hypothetical protein
MIRSVSKSLVYLCIGLVGMATFSCARAEDNLKTISNPGGGEIIYGPMGAQPSVQAAMGYMLRQIHGHYGDRPQVGRLFQDRSGQALAAFFNVTAKNNGGKRIAGLVMVSVPRDGQPSSAVITDDAQRFPKTVNPMLQRLNAEWNANSGPSKASSGTAAPAAAAAASLHQVNFPDGSGSVGLPSGWQMTAAHGGAFEAHGPNGEKLVFGVYTPAIDPTNPQVRQRLNMETQGGRMPLPGMYVAVPYSMDPGKAYISVANQLAQKQRRQPPTINITKVTQNPSQGRASIYVIQADLDAHDGKGFVAMTAEVVRVPPYDAQGNWSMTAYQANVPKPLVAQESGTIAAIFRSYNVNQQVVVGQIQQSIKLNTENTNAVMARTKASQEAFDDKLAHDRANQDMRDKSNQAFANILLDQTVVQDTEHNARGTISNDYADALVKANPNRFQYVPTQDYLKGIDY